MAHDYKLDENKKRLTITKEVVESIDVERLQRSKLLIENEMSRLQTKLDGIEALIVEATKLGYKKPEKKIK